LYVNARSRAHSLTFASALTVSQRRYDSAATVWWRYMIRLQRSNALNISLILRVRLICRQLPPLCVQQCRRKRRPRFPHDWRLSELQHHCSVSHAVTQRVDSVLGIPVLQLCRNVDLSMRRTRCVDASRRAATR